MSRTHPVRFAVALVALAVATGARPSQTPGTIRGRVDAGTLRALSRPSVGDISVSPGAVHDMAPRRQSVVYLANGPRGAFTDLPAGRARLDQQHEQFVPHVLAITAGTTVDFPNNDLTFHNVFSLSPVQSFDLGRYPVGRSKSVRFDHAGVIPVFCDIHSHMSAYILVFTHPFFALTDDDGRYVIPGVPPGTHEIAVWSEAGRADSQFVTVAQGGSVEASFRLGRQRD
jgi:plastocyanin